MMVMIKLGVLATTNSRPSVEIACTAVDNVKSRPWTQCQRE